MKKLTKLAVWLTGVCLCSILAACSDFHDGNEQDKSGALAPVGSPVVGLCTATKNYTADPTGNVVTRGGADVDVRDLAIDGSLKVFTNHHATLKNVAPEYVSQDYSGVNEIQVRGANGTYYTTNHHIKTARVEELTQFSGDFSQMFVVNVTDSADNKKSFYLPVTELYDGDNFIVKNLRGEEVKLPRCKNFIKHMEILSWHEASLNRDSIGAEGNRFNAYQWVIDLFAEMDLKSTTETGEESAGANNIIRFSITLKTIWVPENNGIILPPDKPERVLVEKLGEGFEFVNDSTDESWAKFHDLMSDGTYSSVYRIAVLLKHGIDLPMVDTLEVENFAYTSQQYVVADRVSVGNRYNKEVSISVQKYNQLARTRSSYKDLPFGFWSEGSPIYTDSLGGQHRLPERQWVDFADGGAPTYGWSDKSMSSTEHYDRLKLLSDISASFNEHSHSAQGAVVLKKKKESAPTIIGAEYTDFDIRLISVTNDLITAYSFGTKWKLFSNNTKERIGEVGDTVVVKITAKPVDPVTVTSWDIKDQPAKGYDPTTGTPRTHNVKGQGTYTITPKNRMYQTFTTQSGHTFTIEYDAAMSLKDEYGKTIQFKGLDIESITDLGGVATLTDILPERDYQRKQMTSTIKVVEKATKAEAKSFTTIIFKLLVEREELIVKPHVIAEGCEPLGGTAWRSYRIYEWEYKLAGKQNKTLEQNVNYGVSNRAEKEVKAETATATYTGISGENAWKAGTPFAGTMDGVKVTRHTTVPTEGYTLFTDEFDGVKETATFNGTLAGEAISFTFPTPSMTIVHAEPTTNAGGEVTRDGQKYSVTEHNGPITANVSYGGKSQNVTATDVTKILVKKSTNMPPIDPLIEDEVISVGKMVLSPRVSGGNVSTWDVTLTFNGQKAFYVMDCNTNQWVFTANKPAAAGARGASAPASSSWEQQSDGSWIYTYGGESWRIPAEALSNGGAGSSFERVQTTAGARRAATTGTQTYTNVNGGINVNGQWKACWIEKASANNAYVYRWGNGADYYVVPVNLFCIGGAAHLSESGNARQDPWITTNAVPTTYDDGVIYTVTGVNNVGSAIRAIVKVGFKKD